MRPAPGLVSRPAAELHAERSVLRVADWTGGEGAKPAISGYIGLTGIVATAAEAIDVRGAPGLPGQDGAPGAKGDPGRRARPASVASHSLWMPQACWRAKPRMTAKLQASPTLPQTWACCSFGKGAGWSEGIPLARG